MSSDGDTRLNWDEDYQSSDELSKLSEMLSGNISFDTAKQYLKDHKVEIKEHFSDERYVDSWRKVFFEGVLSINKQDTQEKMLKLLLEFGFPRDHGILSDCCLQKDCDSVKMLVDIGRWDPEDLKYSTAIDSSLEIRALFDDWFEHPPKQQ